MKQSCPSALLLYLMAALLPSHSANAQNLTPYAVVAPCSPANAPSRFQRLTGNTLTDIGAITVAGTPVTVNGLGYDSGDPDRTFALGVNTAAPNQVPLYQISTINGAAVNLGLIPAPPIPVVSPPQFGQSVTFNLIGDGAPGRKFYVLGLSAVVTFAPFSITNARLYVGEIDLSTPVVSPVPTWRQATLDAGSQAFINGFLAQSTAYFAGTGPLPEGGIQDWLFDPASNSLISYLGQDQRFLRVTNITTTPSAVLTTPTTLLPVALNIGGLYRDNTNNVFAIASDNGTVYQIDRLTGNYTGTSFSLGVSCLRGDAATGPSPVTLPVELVGFSATPEPDGTVALRWRTASESHVAGFRVERQTGPIDAPWQLLERTHAANRQTGAAYTARDLNPTASVLRYRLVTVDDDESVAYSAAVEARFTAAPVVGPLTPNPATDAVELALSAPLTVPGIVAVYDAHGSLVATEVLQSGRTRLSVQSLPAGLYSVVATYAGTRTSQRLLVTR